MKYRPTVVIVGAGFGGLAAGRALAHMPVHVTIIDRNNFHTFQPLLYQVATAALDPEEIGNNVRGIFHAQNNFHFRMGSVCGADWGHRVLLLENGETVHFDYLIVAAGAITTYYGIPGIEQSSYPLKSMEEAVDLRSHIMQLFETADAFPDQVNDGLLNFVVVGGGPTGVEMAGALTEWFQMVLRRDYPDLDLSKAAVFLVEAMDHLLPAFNGKLRQEAKTVLLKRGVRVLLNESVVEATPYSVTLKSGLVLPTRTIIWSAGIKANPLGTAMGFELTHGNRVIVNPDLSVPGHQGVFVIGDMAACKDDAGNWYPQVAQVAIQGGKHVVRQIRNLECDQPTAPFIYRDYGSMATIGRSAAVVQFPNGLQMTGFTAWLAWLLLHLVYLIGFRNRLNVLVNWAWNYFTYDRSPRLIMRQSRHVQPVTTATTDKQVMKTR